MADPAHAFRQVILAALGHAPKVIEPGRFQRFPTSDRRADDAGWCKLFDDLRAGVFGCFRSGLSETWSAADRATMTQEQGAELARQIMAATVKREAQQRQRWAENARRNGQVWAQCMPLVAGDPATLYLKRRGFGRVWPLPAMLRLHFALPYWHGTEMLGTFPAMVAPIIALDGRTLALHRTYLMADGRKADVPSPKKLTGASGPLAGACIALHPARAGVIGIAEGIETALAAWCASAVPTVAAYSAGNLAAWRWRAGAHTVIIFADHDPAGLQAADKLCNRAKAAGLRCQVLTPTHTGSDWCDIWAQRGAMTLEGVGP